MLGAGHAAGMGETTIKHHFFSTLDKIIVNRESKGCDSNKGPT